MNKDQIKKEINSIFSIIEKSEVDGNIYEHPGLYIYKSREELDMEIDSCLFGKNNFDKYDIMYIANSLINSFIGKDDSHTYLIMQKEKLFPIVFKVIDNEVYVLNTVDSMKDVLYGKLTSVNNLDINIIKKEFEQMIPSTTKEHFDTILGYRLSSINYLRSLPSIDNNISEVEYTIEKDNEIKKAKFNTEIDYGKIEDITSKNYTYELIDNTIVIHFTSCSNIEKMKEFIKEIDSVTSKNNIKNYIIDIRGNLGGNSRVSNLLYEYLKSSNIINIVTLVDNHVYSSAIMFVAQLKTLGSYFIGTGIGSTLSCFGDQLRTVISQLDLILLHSHKYFMYDNNMNLKVLFKNTFDDTFKTKEDFKSFNKIIFKPDEYSYKTLEDYKNSYDPVLEKALMFINNKEMKERI